MTDLLRPRGIVSIVGLTLMWCAFWGTISAANVGAGLLIALAITALGLGSDGAGGVRLVPLVRLVWLVTVDLVKSTASVAGEILTPTDYTDESIVSVDVGPAGRNHLLLLTVAITLTPGTAVINTDADAGTIYLHILHDKRRQDTLDHVEKLTRLAEEALPTLTPNSTP